MPTFIQSAFLQALGYAIANSLWQAALAWLVFMVMNSAFSFSAAARYRFAVLAQVSSFVWFMVTFRFYYTQDLNSVGLAIHQPLLSAGNTSLLVSWLIKAEKGLPYLSMAYLLLMGFLVTRWILGYRHTQMIRSTGLQKIPVDWRLFVKKVSAQLGIRKEIRLFLSAHVTTPLTIGFLKPVILVPVAGINHLTTEQLEAVLLHELAHIKRYDYLFNMAISVMELTLFFNPFTQLLGRTIQKERENSCDDWVLQFQYNASEYAEALLRIACMQPAPVFAMAASGKKNELLTRIKRMVGQEETGNHFNYRKQLLAFLLVTVTLGSVAWLSPVSSRIHTETTIGRISLHKVDAITSHIENPLFNPTYFLPERMKREMKKETNALSETEKERTSENAVKVKTATGEDKLVLYKKMNNPFSELLDRSLTEAKPGIEKAKKEMDMAMTQAADAVVTEDNGVKLELRNAYDEIKKLDLEKIVINALRFADLSEIEKDQFISLKNLGLSEKDKDLLRKELKEKQKMRIANPGKITAGSSAPLMIISKAFHPLTLINEEDDKQVVKIKLAILQQLNVLLSEKVLSIEQPKKESADIILLEQ